MNRPDATCPCGEILGIWNESKQRYDPPFDPNRECPGCGKTVIEAINDALIIAQMKRKATNPPN